MSRVRPDDATEDEVLAEVAGASFVALGGQGAELAEGGRGLLFKALKGAARPEGAATM